MKKQSWIQKNLNVILWIATVTLSLALIFTTILVPEHFWVPTSVGVILLGALGLLAYRHKQDLMTKRTAFGFYSFITTLLVLGIVVVINFFGYQYPQKIDLTKNQLHTFADQTRDVMKNLSMNVNATFFSSLGEREQYRPILDEYKGLSRKFKLQYIDPTRNPTRAKQAGINRSNTLFLAVGDRNSKIEDPTEEKITNELIKLTRKEDLTICSIEGHGERSFESKEADGYSELKQGLENLAYRTRVLQLAQQSSIPNDCTAIVIAGPSRAFFPQEVKMISEYLDRGGRAMIAIDLDLKGGRTASELAPLLSNWGIQVNRALIVDPLSKMLGVDAAVPIIPTFSTSHPITQEFRKDIRNTNCFFPFTSPLQATASPPKGLRVDWLGKTSPQSWAEFNLKSLSQGKVKFDDGTDQRGPNTVAMVTSGKPEDSKATTETRLVVFGTSLFAANNYARLGLNNDLMLNTVSWLVSDEKGITIRKRDDDPGTIELTKKTGTTIFWISVVISPLLIAILGIVVWIRRRKL